MGWSSGGSMTYKERPPHPALSPFVDRFWLSTAEAGAGPRRILPDGCIDLLVDVTRDGTTVAVGTMTRAILFHPRAPVRTAAVRFKPGGAVPFLKVSADELTDRVIPCAEIGLRWLGPGALGGFASLTETAAALERLLLDRLREIAPPNPIVTHAVSRLFGPQPPSIEDLSHELGWSRQHLGRAFRRHIGVNPKQLARTARLQRAVDELQRGRRASLAAAAAHLGYFDQAHMAHDFRDMAGVTPQVAGASAGSIFPIRSLFSEG
jgi:AraC-like DNA-binding protein